MGTTVNFENHACRAAELRLPPGGGEELDVHQHCLDYGLVFLGDSSTKMCTLHCPSRALPAALNGVCRRADHPGENGGEPVLQDGDGAIPDGMSGEYSNCLPPLIG